MDSETVWTVELWLQSMQVKYQNKISRGTTITIFNSKILVVSVSICCTINLGDTAATDISTIRLNRPMGGFSEVEIIEKNHQIKKVKP